MCYIYRTQYTLRRELFWMEQYGNYSLMVLKLGSVKLTEGEKLCNIKDLIITYFYSCCVKNYYTILQWIVAYLKYYSRRNCFG